MCKEIYKIIPKFTWKLWIKNNLSSLKVEWSSVIHTTGQSRLVLNIVYYCCKQDKDKLTRIESSETYLHLQIQLMYETAPLQYGEERCSFQ